MRRFQRGFESFVPKRNWFYVVGHCPSAKLSTNINVWTNRNSKIELVPRLQNKKKKKSLSLSLRTEKNIHPSVSCQLLEFEIHNIIRLTV